MADVGDPVPGPGEVLIRVRAAGVNFADTLILAGKYQEKPPLPFIPGFEAAGEVVGVGPGVTRLKVGARVLASLDKGAFAELAVAREADVFPLPEKMDFATAAGFPITYGTAHGALIWRAALQPKETLVVHGAAGGVGLAAVEVGKALGARVIATAGGPEKLAIAKAQGADDVIDYKAEDLRQRLKDLTDGRGADVYFDPVGGSAFEASLRAIAWSGRLVTIGYAGGEVPQVPANVLLVKNIAVIGFYWGSYRRHAPHLLIQQFDQLFAWFSEGKLHPHISHRLPLDKAGEAFQMLKDRSATGKIVLEVS